MKKNFLALLLVTMFTLVLGFGFIGCGQKEEPVDLPVLEDIEPVEGSEEMEDSGDSDLE